MKDITITIKPMLFCFDEYYPNGGWDDFKGYFDSVDDAKQNLYENASSWLLCCGYAHIVVDGKIVWKGEYGYRDNSCENFEWRDQEIT